MVSLQGTEPVGARSLLLLVFLVPACIDSTQAAKVGNEGDVVPTASGAGDGDGSAASDAGDGDGSAASDSSDEFLDAGRATDGGHREGGLIARRLLKAAPTFEGNANPAVPQVGIVSVTTLEESSGNVTISGAGEEWDVALDETAAVHVKPIFGLRPATTYTATLLLQSASTSVITEPVQWTTPALPEQFPPIIASLSEPERMEPGMTLFNLRAPTGSMVIVDHAGVVRWYYYDRDRPVKTDHRRLPNGNFLFERGHRLVVEVDPLGNVEAQWHAARYPVELDIPSDSIAVDVESFHHEISILDSGNFLVLSTEQRTVEAFPTSYEDPAAPTESAVVIGTVVVEFTPEGEIVKRISLFDLLDPMRIARGSLRDKWPETFGEGVRAWSHGNAVVYEDETDSYYVSLRHQDAVVRIDRSTEELVWIFGTHANWRQPWSELLLTPEGDLTWPFHQHALELTPRGLGLYDNGNYRAAAFEAVTEPEYSRAVIYDVDAVAMTVREVWSYGSPEGEDSFYSSAMGDADWQGRSGNVLLTNAIVEAGDGRNAQLLEITPSGERVFQLDVGDGTLAAIYRAQRLPDIRY